MDYIKDLYDLEQTLAKDWLAGYRYPWEALPRLGEFIAGLGASLPKEEYRETAPQVWVHATAEIASTAVLTGPCIIGRFAEVRGAAMIRGNVLVGEGCVVGVASALKNTVLFSGVVLQHNNFISGSIIGTRAFIGAGVVAACEKQAPVVRDPAGDIDTGSKKVGAFLGDFVEIGANSVLRSGAVVGRNAPVPPLTCVEGVIPGRAAAKSPVSEEEPEEKD